MTGLPASDVKTAELNSVTLAYREIGSGHPLLLINGFASPMDTWNPPVLSLLAQAFRVIVFDNRGTGYSTASGEPFSIPLFAADTAALMDILGITRAHILGLSMGASIAQELVLAHPDRVERLVLAAGTCGGPEMIPVRKETWDRLVDKSGSPEELADRMFSVLFPKEWLAMHDPWQYCPEVHETTTEEIAARQEAAFFGWSGSWERLPKIRCPALVITGSDDYVIPPENSRILASRIPGSRLAEIPGAGHGIQYQCPQDFADTVIRFLQGRSISGTAHVKQESE